MSQKPILTIVSITHCFAENDEKLTDAREMVWNRSWKSGTCQQLSNLQVALISKIKCRFLANERRNGEYHV